MRRLRAAFAIGLAILMLAGCGDLVVDPGESSTPGASAPTVPAEAPDGTRPIVGVVLPDAAAASRWTSVDGVFREAFDAAGLDLIVREANGDAPAAASALVADGAATVIVANLGDEVGDPGALEVPVIDLHRTNGRADAVVMVDGKAIGAQAGTALVTCLRDVGVTSGPVVLLGDPASTEGQALAGTMTDAGYAVAAQLTVPDAAVAGTEFERFYVQANGDVVGIAADADAYAGPVIEVLNANAQAGKVPVVGVGGTPEALARIADGTQCASVAVSARDEASAAAEVSRSLLAGDTAPGALIEPRIVTAGNVGDATAAGDLLAP